jgi:hypothetical protein
MNSSRALCRQAFAAVLTLLFAFAIATPTFAQRQLATKYAKGDRVEIEQGFEWKKGTVVSVDRESGWIEVRVDDGEDEAARFAPRDMPADMRERMMTRNVPADRVRPLAKARTTVARTWTDRTGKFKVKAQFDGVVGDSVVLNKAGGKQVKVPIEKLSERDQQFVNKQRESTGGSENPFGEVNEIEDEVTVTDEEEVPSNAVKGNLRDVKNVRPKTFTKWTFKPNGKTEQLLTAAGSRDVEVQLSDIPESQKFFENVEGIYVSSDGNRIIVARTKGAVAQKKPQYLQLVDVARQRAGELVQLPEQTAILDAEPDQGLVMYRPEIFGHGKNRLLTIARLDGEELTPIAEFEPYAHEDWAPSRDIESARFLSSDRVMTINPHGKALTIWDIDQAKALLNIPVGISFSLKMAVSPDRSLLGVIMQDGIAIIDLTQGEHVATIPTTGRNFDQVEFRADNSRLAGLSGSGVTVWDLTDGEVRSEFGSNAMGGYRQNLAWAGEFLLSQNQYLFDVERRILLWEYQGSSGSAESATMRNGRLYVIPKLEDGSDTMLVSAALPHRTAIEEAKRLPSPDELLVVKPGDEVQLIVDIDPSVPMTEDFQKAIANKQKAAQAEPGAANVVFLQPGAAIQDTVRELLKAGIEKAGLKVVEKSDLVVKAVCKPQEQQTIKVNVDGRWPIREADVQERTITPHASYLEMTYKGEELWKCGFVAKPFMTIWMNQGENLDQALQRLTQPNLTIFTHAQFSPYVAKPGKATPNGAYGASQFTDRGIVDTGSTGNGRVAFE